MSILTPQNVEVRFGKADTKSSTKLTLPGTLDVAQNVVMTETGRYDRRPGTSLLTTEAGVRNIHDHGNELLLGTPDALLSRFGNPVANNNRGSLTSFDTRTETVNNTPFSQLSHDMVVSNGYQWSVWADGRGGIRYSVRDVASGAYLVSEGIISSSIEMTAPRVFAVSTNILVTYVDGPATGLTTLYGRKIDTAAPTVVGTETTIDAEYLAGASFALNGYDGVVLSGSTGGMVLAYTCAFGGSSTDERLRLKLWNVGTMSATTTLSEAFDSNGSGRGGIAIIDSASSYYVVHCSGAPKNRIRLLIAAADLSSFTTTAVVKDFAGATNLYHVTGFVDGSAVAWIFAQADATSGATTRSVIHLYTRTSGGVVSENGTRYGWQLTSSVFSSGGTRYFCVLAPLPGGSTTTASWFVMNAITGALVGRALSRRASTTRLLETLPVPQLTSSGFVVAADYQLSTSQAGASLVYIEPSVRRKWLECQGTTVIPGSWPRIYDGLGVTELGFEGPPNIVNSAQSGSSGLADGLYYYRLTWFWVDGTGFEHESEPCPAELFTVTGGPRNVTLTAETLTATLKAAPSQGAILRVYRTTGNPSSASGAAFFLAGTAANSTTAVTISFVDEIPDALLVTRQRLYTLGDTVLANTPTSPTGAMAAWGGRLWSADGEALVYSKLIEDAKGVAHSDVNFEVVADSYGDFVALADGGSRLLAFKRTAIYSRSGLGPSNTGVGEFPPIDRLELPLGARSQHSVVSTEVGVLFQDHMTGQIWLIGDSGAEYIGADIEGVLGGATVVDAVQVGRQVRFYTAGTTYVFDLHHKIWTWSTGQAAVGAGAINGVAHYVTSGGDVRYDNAAVWTEAGTSYQAVLETGWLSFAGLAGHQRTYRVHALGENLGAHTVSFKPSYRFGTSTETKSLASSAILAGHGYRVEFKPSLAYQRSTAIKLRIEDNSPSTAGWGLEALNLEVGIDRKAARLPSAHRAG